MQQYLWFFFSRRIVIGDITKPIKSNLEDEGKFIERLEDWDTKNYQIITSIPTIHTQFDVFDNAKSYEISCLLTLNLSDWLIIINCPVFLLVSIKKSMNLLMSIS